MLKIKRILLIIWSLKKEIITYISLLVGWSSFTYGLYDVFGLTAVKLSLGIFLIGMSIGFKPLLIHLVYGLYSLSEEE